MKSIILTALVLTACSAGWAAETVPVAITPVPSPTTPIPMEAKAAGPQTVVSSVPNFCGQADVARLVMNTDVGKKLQLQQQEEIRQAIAQMVADSNIPTPPGQQPTATNPKAARSVEVPATKAGGVAPLK